MSDDGQNITTDENQTLDQSAEQAANEALENSAVMPDLSDIEYATPSAYIDPDLPAYNPDQPVEEEPEEEEEEQDILEMTPEEVEEYLKNVHAVMSQVAEKIANSRNILIATSSDPSVDELSAAITLTRFLDRLGKHAIAIYSGEAPKALEFLTPAEYFENSADVLQDFVVSLNKEKADHLRYKLDGEEVKVLITPYRTRITQEDLTFSYGDYNVDLVLSLNVNKGIDLDPALREYGTIMQDATVINITTGNPGKFGEIEWNNKRASSVSEMVADLLCNASGDVTLEPEEATALLTGIVASTDRFAHANTFSTTMQIASQLIDFGASPETVAENITDDVDNQFFSFSDLKPKKEGEEGEEGSNISFSFKPTKEVKGRVDPNDATALLIAHGDEEQVEPKEIDTEEEKEEEKPAEEPVEEPKEEPKEEEKPAEEPKEEPKEEEKPAEEPKPEDPGLMDELKATEASLSNVTPETVETPAPSPVQLNAPSLDNPVPNIPTMETPAAAPAPSPLSDFSSNKYSQMLEDALNEPAAGSSAPMESSLPPVNPAATSAPEVTGAPEMSGMPEINYGQNDGSVLPPPPTPPVDMNQSMPLPSTPDMSAPAAPAAPAPSTPDTFTIPGV
ncbi:hypothetical protein IKG07_02395 [Candidatus Saccharibacteria bacterium]|nr:hypothetical protein [Candidatus Saccharibacteria bacterium]